MKTVKLVPAPEKSERGDWNLYPGRKAIMVDGVLYGYAILQRRGSNGACYTFAQAGGGSSRISDERTTPRGPRFSDVEVWSDKIAQRKAGRMVRLSPFKERLLAKAQELVEDGRLIPEAAQLTLIANREKQAADAEARLKAKKDAKFEAKAVEVMKFACVDVEPANLDYQQEILRDAIVAAMRWAQTQ